jgi:hypothetical protein
LSDNTFGLKGARAIAKALKENINLQTIHIHHNSIGDKGANAIAEAIKENRSLVKLCIGSNNISELGGKDILNALRQIESSEIREIDLKGNEMSEKTLEKIDEQINQIIHRTKGIIKGTRILKAISTKQLQSKLELMKDEVMAQKDKEIGELQSTIETIHDKAAEKDERIARLKMVQLQLMEKIGDLEKIGDQQATIDELHVKIAAQDEEVASLGLKRSQTIQLLVEKESTIAELNSEITKVKGTAGFQLAKKDDEIDKIMAEVLMERSETTRKMAELQSAIAQKDINIAKKDKEIACLRLEQSQMLQQLEELNGGSEALGNYTNCCVCLEPYEVDSNSLGSQRLPIKSATCAHSLCEGCLDGYHASLMNGRSTLRYVRCPQCNDKTKKAFDIQNKVVDLFLREYIQCRKRKRLT